jgi:GNAT superfamily N-acetyltransferase
MVPSATIREAKPEDASRIAFVHVRTWQSAYRGQVPDEFLDSLSVEKREQAWNKWFAGEEIRPNEVFVAEVEGAVVGFANIGHSRDTPAEEDTGELRAIYLLPDYWDTRTGAALMDVATDALRRRFKRATLWVLDSNDRARRFYERGGWSHDGTTIDDDSRGFVLREVRYRIEF